MTSSAAATIARMPIQKWSMKATSRNTGVQGASKIAAIAGLAIAVRIESKSRIACAATPESVGHHLGQNARGENGVEPLAGADQQPVADHVEQRQRQQRQRQAPG